MTTRRWSVLAAAVFALAFVGAMGGCEREVSRDSDTRYYRDGSIRHNDDRVYRNSDGTMTRERTMHTENP